MSARPILTTLAAGGLVALLGAAAPASDHARSVAAFDEMAQVMTSPRCQNCHTLTGFPRQGDDRHRHVMNVQRGADGMGAPAMRCATCHSRANYAASGVPGADEAWRLAPLSMGWEGLSQGALCRQLKDPKHNGGRTGADVIDHLKTHLVVWAWSPGATAHGHGRTSPPIDHATFLKAAETWVATGQACPG